MAQCRATTRKGSRCKNPAMDGSEYCGVHAGMQEGGEQGDGAGSKADGRRLWNQEFEEMAKMALGAALVGAVVLLAITRRR